MINWRTMYNNNYLYNYLILNFKNIFGPASFRKIVTIDCDDWGGIRMPPGNLSYKLGMENLPLTKTRYRFDTLESRKDLEMLFDILCSVKDNKGNNAVITAVTNVANPDFIRIKESGYSNYYYEKFTDTLRRHYPDSDVFTLWKQGINSGIFIPELHGREHISVFFWLKRLREGDKNLIKAFENEFVHLKVDGIPEPVSEFRAAFYFNDNDQKLFLVEAIKDGIKLFKEIFGFSPRIFVPSNNLFHPDFDRIVAEEKVKFLYSSYRMRYPGRKGKLKYKNFIIKNNIPKGITYYTRNCSFEPTDENYRGIDLTMQQIAAAFRWGKIAIISTHRANFTGEINPSNREKGLREFKKLLKKIVSTWPDVEFMSTADALEIVVGSK